MTGLRRGVAVIAMGGLVLAGCDHNHDVSPSTLSANQLARRANAICARYQVEYRGGRSLKTRAETLRYLDRTRPVQEREERELRALHPPEELRSAVDELLAHDHEAQLLFNQLRRAVATGNGNRQIEIMRQLGRNARRDKKDLLALGWTVCASPPE